MLKAKGSDNTNPRRVAVWDLPTRLFHWLLVIFVLISYSTAKLGGNAMPYHLISGYGILALLLFRVAWGFVGSRPSRFSSFVRGPATVFRHAAGLMSRRSPGYLGHNPLGGWSVMAMLLVLLIQAATGLFANDDIFTEGPMAVHVSKAASDWLTRIHRLNSDVIVMLVSLHVAAVVFYLLVKRENLITPMITGIKWWAGRSDPVGGNLLSAAGLGLLCALAVYMLVR